MSSTLSPTLVRTTDGPARKNEELFVISTHKVRDKNGKPPFAWVPYGVEHAWQPGARRTLCGQWTSGWTVFWERRFSATPSTACPSCIEASLPENARRRLDTFEQAS
jgi:hypothetical protein